MSEAWPRVAWPKSGARRGARLRQPGAMDNGRGRTQLIADPMSHATSLAGTWSQRAAPRFVRITLCEITSRCMQALTRMRLLCSLGANYPFGLVRKTPLTAFIRIGLVRSNTPDPMISGIQESKGFVINDLPMRVPWTGYSLP